MLYDSSFVTLFPVDRLEQFSAIVRTVLQSAWEPAYWSISDFEVGRAKADQTHIRKPPFMNPPWTESKVAGFDHIH
jgi:hypothetical protein